MFIEYPVGLVRKKKRPIILHLKTGSFEYEIYIISVSNFIMKMKLMSFQEVRID